MTKQLYQISKLETKVKEDVEIRLLAIDPEDSLTKEFHKRIYKRSLQEDAKANLNALSGLNNVKIRVLKFPNPVRIYAKDYSKRGGGTSRGRINVRFKIHGRNLENDRCPCLNLTPGDKEWYKLYQEQIERLWEMGADWKPEGKADDQD